MVHELRLSCFGYYEETLHLNHARLNNLTITE